MGPKPLEGLVTRWGAQLGMISYQLRLPSYLPGNEPRPAVDLTNARTLLEEAIREAFAAGAAYQVEIAGLPAIFPIPDELNWADTPAFESDAPDPAAARLTRQELTRLRGNPDARS